MLEAGFHVFLHHVTRSQAKNFSNNIVSVQLRRLTRGVKRCYLLAWFSATCEVSVMSFDSRGSISAVDRRVRSMDGGADSVTGSDTSLLDRTFDFMSSALSGRSTSFERHSWDLESPQRVSLQGNSNAPTAMASMSHVSATSSPSSLCSDDLY